MTCSCQAQQAHCSVKCLRPAELWSVLGGGIEPPVETCTVSIYIDIYQGQEHDFMQLPPC